MLGLPNIDVENTPFPYRVEATKLCQMFTVTRRQMLGSFSRMTTMDELACRAAIKMEHQKNIKSLSDELDRRQSHMCSRTSRFTYNDDDDAFVLPGQRDYNGSKQLHVGLPYDPSMPLGTQCVLSTHALQRTCVNCKKELRDMQKALLVLPQVLANVRSLKKIAANGRRRRSVLKGISGQETDRRQRRPSVFARMLGMGGRSDTSNNLLSPGGLLSPGSLLGLTSGSPDDDTPDFNADLSYRSNSSTPQGMREGASPPATRSPNGASHSGSSRDATPPSTRGTGTPKGQQSVSFHGSKQNVSFRDSNTPETGSNLNRVGGLWA